MSSFSWTKERSRVALLSKTHSPDDPIVLEAKRDLRAARLAEYVEKIVAEAPPLTAEQRDRIAGLLRGSSEPTPTPRVHAEFIGLFEGSEG